jgi:hypothetical protein
MLWERLPVIERTNIRIEDLDPTIIVGSFRFKSTTQLLRLRNGFQFPSYVSTGSGHRFSGDEILLCGLYRLHFPNKFSDAGWRLLFGFDEKRASECFSIFMKHMFMRNAQVAMNGCQTTQFFNCPPPSFEEWVQQGPRFMEMPIGEDVMNES